MDNKQNLRKFEVMKVFNSSVIKDYPQRRESPSDYKNPEFREELIDILRRPFNLEEYRSLMQKAKYRHLMGGPEYSDGLKGKEVSNKYGKSPLDYHPDFSTPALCPINLGENALLTHVGIHYLASALGTSLKELFMDNCSRIYARLVASVLKEHLEVLSVAAGLPNVCDRVVSDIITECGKNIKDLDLGNCERLIDFSLNILGQTCFDLRMCPRHCKLAQLD